MCIQKGQLIIGSYASQNDLLIMNLVLLQLPQEEARMTATCQSMISLYPNQSYPLEVLCHHYLKTGKITFKRKSLPFCIHNGCS